MGEILSDNDPQSSPAVPPAAAAQPPGEDWQGIPLAQMTDAQKAAYWQHYARKHETAAKAFDGLTPQQVAEMKSKLETLEAEKLTADEKALKAAREEAMSAAAEAAKAEYLPKLHAAEVRSIASDIIHGDALKSFMSVVNPSAFLSEGGEIDETKVMAALTGMFGAPQHNQPPQRWQNAGQYSPPPPPGRPGEGGRAEASRRFGKQSNTTP